VYRIVQHTLQPGTDGDGDGDTDTGFVWCTDKILTFQSGACVETVLTHFLRSAQYTLQNTAGGQLTLATSRCLYLTMDGRWSLDLSPWSVRM
jgi:hypothetical protein